MVDIEYPFLLVYLYTCIKTAITQHVLNEDQCLSIENSTCQEI